MKLILSLTICIAISILTIALSGLIVLSGSPSSGGNMVAAVATPGDDDGRRDVELQVLAGSSDAAMRTARYQRLREREAQSNVAERVAPIAQSSKSSSGTKWIYVPQF